MNKEWIILSKKDDQKCIDRESYINPTKNRYIDVLPFEGTRVMLPSDTYINASYVKLSKEKRIIATQAPLENTISDFWEMVWSSGTNYIFMLTGLFERGKEKALMYWPDKYNKKLTINEFCSIHFVSKTKTNDLIETKLLIKFGKHERLIHHLWYNGWKDMEAPPKSESVIKLANMIDLADSTPIIHCSAGCGRTGLLCAVYRMMKTKESPFQTVEKLRKYRKGMVQTKKQYEYIHKLKMINS